DIDDTLILERDYVRSGFSAVGELVEQEFQINGFADRAWERFESGARGNIFDDVLKQVEIRADQALISRLVDAYRRHTPKVALLEDVKRFVVESKQHLRFAIISDGPELAQRKKVEALRLADWADPILLTDCYGKECWKPSTFAFERVMQHIGEKPEKLVYIADNPGKDFVPAKRVGWRTVRIRRKGGEHE